MAGRRFWETPERNVVGPAKLYAFNGVRRIISINETNSPKVEALDRSWGLF
jgi:hypothetical protein